MCALILEIRKKAVFKDRNQSSGEPSKALKVTVPFLNQVLFIR